MKSIEDLVLCDWHGESVEVHVKAKIEDGEQELLVTDFRNLGNQYLQHTEGGFIQCECCGACVKETNNRCKYCRECAVEIDRVKAIDRYYTRISQFS